MTNTREFPNLDQFSAIITMTQQDFNSRQSSKEVPLCQNIVLIPRRIRCFSRFPVILALNAERKFVRDIQRRQSWENSHQYNSISEVHYFIEADVNLSEHCFLGEENKNE